MLSHCWNDLPRRYKLFLISVRLEVVAEKLLLPDEVLVSEKTVSQRGKWTDGHRKGQLIIKERSGDDTEDWCRIEIYTFGGKRRLSATMNRGITLYADYLPIYKDIIAQLEKVAEEYKGRWDNCSENTT